MTEFYRGGYCRSGAADYGNHAVAGIVSQEFLDFTASQGNDLRVAGLSGGCKRCFCTSRWLEAYEAMKRGVISEKAVPKVQLNATHESALDGVDLDTFKKYAVEEGSTPWRDLRMLYDLRRREMSSSLSVLSLRGPRL